MKCQERLGTGIHLVILNSFHDLGFARIDSASIPDDERRANALSHAILRPMLGVQSECFCRANRCHVRGSPAWHAMRTPNMTSWGWHFSAYPLHKNKNFCFFNRNLRFCHKFPFTRATLPKNEEHGEFQRKMQRP